MTDAAETRLLLEDDPLRRLLLRLLGARGLGLKVLAASAGLWAVAAVLSAAEGVLVRGTMAEARSSWTGSMYALFLFSMPLLTATASGFSRIQNAVLTACRDGRVFDMPDDDYAATVEKANRVLAHRGMHAVLFAGAWVASVGWSFSLLLIRQPTWHGFVEGEGLRRPSLALIYIAVIAMPLPLYAIFAWAWKAMVWNWLIWKLARQEPGLKLNALHPDGVGGMGMMKYSSLAWGTYIVCVGLTIAGDTFNYAYVMKMSLARWDIIAKLGSYCILAPALFLTPLAILTPGLLKARRDGELLLFLYGRRYADELRKATVAEIDGGKGSRPSAMQDCWSGMCDFATVYDNVRRMRLWPLDVGSMARMLVTVVGPLVPLLLPRIPFVGDLLRKVL